MSARVSLSEEAQEALDIIARHRRCSASRAAEYAILKTMQMLPQLDAAEVNPDEDDIDLLDKEI